MWIPEWLGVPYCILYTKYGIKEFSFEDAKEELKGLNLPEKLKKAYYEYDKKYPCRG